MNYSVEELPLDFKPDCCFNESEVITKFIVSYLLPALGYQPDQWYQEVAVPGMRFDVIALGKSRQRPMTLTALGMNPPHLVIEAKHPRQNLNRHVRRIRTYLSHLQGRYGLLTNGQELRIYERCVRDDHEEIKLIFECSGWEVSAHLEAIRALLRKPEGDRESALNQAMPDQAARAADPAAANPPWLTRSSNTLPLIYIYAEMQAAPNEKGEGIRWKVTLMNHPPATHSPEVTHPPQVPHPLSKQLVMEQTTMRTIAVYHNKGGVGKTTVSVNLAAAFAKKGKRVLLIDMDAQANATFATGLIKFQFEEEDTIINSYVYHLLESGNFGFIPDVARLSNGFNTPEIAVIPSHIKLIESQEKLNKVAVTRQRIFNKLKHVQDDYDVVIIDTPPSRDLYAEIPLVTADYLIIPSDLKPFSNQGLPTVKKFVEEVNEFRASVNRNPLVILGVLPSKISTNAQFMKFSFPRQINVVMERYEVPLMETIIYERAVLSNCLGRTQKEEGLEIPNPKSIFEFSNIERTTAAEQAVEDFERLADEVLTKIA